MKIISTKQYKEYQQISQHKEISKLMQKGERLATFAMKFFQGLPFLYSKIILPFAKLCSTFEEKLLFSSNIIL